ncbi:MAG: hypothetical protein LUE26_11395 [Alistipes sp.]|nr:hypothetical protein [Alistipes sp.]
MLSVYKKIVIRSLAAGCLTLGAVSCTDNDIETPTPEISDGRVRIELFTNSTEYTRPVSTRADETGLSYAPMVLVYTGSGTAAVFSEAARSVFDGSKTTVSLTPVESTEKCLFVVIENPPATLGDGITQFTADGLNTLLGASTLADLETLLRTPSLNNPQTANLYGTADLLPMSGISAEVNGIDENTKIYNVTDGSDYKMSLARAVAKATVTSSLTGFDVTGMGAVNVAAHGALWSDDNTAVAAGTYGMVAYRTAAAGGDVVQSGTGPLYFYETAASHEPALIIKATLSGDTYYYKLAFSVDGAYLDILRNKAYEFEITAAGPGYSTLQEAVDGPPSNIVYKIKVTDGYSHDIVSNGQYYLGVSNSTVLVYGAMTNLTDAFIVSTDATTAMGVTTATITATDGITVTPSTVNLAETNGGVTPVKVTMTTSTTSGTATITLGNLTRTINFARYPNYNFQGFAALPGDDYVDIEIVSVTGDWFKMMDSDYNIFSDNNTFREGKGLFIAADIYISDNNYRDAEFYASRSGNSGRSKVFVRQEGYYVNLHRVTHTVPDEAYVGAFWRADQTGERLIRVPYSDYIEGDWVATVIEGEDWIILDTEPTLDSGVTWDEHEDPADMRADDALYQVNGGAISVGGTVSGPEDEIYFRIGLRDKIDQSGPPRYGVIFISVENHLKNRTLYWRMFIRQGEQDDYLMRPDDLTPTGESYGTPNRPYAVRIPVFNLTAPEYASDPDYFATTGRNGTTATQHLQVAVKGGVFTDYPTQAGALFQWANATHLRRAFHPSLPSTGQISGWDYVNPTGFWPTLESVHETCPPGYRRPMDHVDLNSVIIASTTDIPANSEIRQSLMAEPSRQNSVAAYGYMAYGGYYADGFFDRRVIGNREGTDSSVPYRSVASTTAHVAYGGVVFCNPYDHGSIFLPLAGIRNQYGILQSTVGNYHTVTPVGTYTIWTLVLNLSSPTGYNNNAAISMGSNSYRYHCASIRCVVDE